MTERKKKVVIIPIEPIETRYTKHWYEYVHVQFKRYIPDKDVIQIYVPWEPVDNTDGGFLNFSATIGYKSMQMAVVSDMFSTGEISNGDVILFMDYWNPGVQMVKYMSILNGIDVKLVGICHAGMWDPFDILGRKFKSLDGTWGKDIEKSLDNSYDIKIFATKYSKSLYELTFGESDKNVVCGFPMEYYDKVMPCYWDLPELPQKENLIVFPHRKSPEKHLDLFLAIKEKLGNKYEFVVSLDECQTKDEYHRLLYRAKLCFSASLQETLGISIGIEALRAGCDVMVPDRLSYSEMFFPYFKYEGDIAHKYEYTRHDLDELVRIVDYRMSLPIDLDIIRQQLFDNSKFFNGYDMYRLVNEL